MENEAPPSVYLPLLSVAYYLSDGLTKKALGHHLKILHIATGHAHKKLSSVHNLMSKYNHLKTEIDITYICRHPTCENILVVGDDKYPKLIQSCGHKHLKNNSSDNMVIRLPAEKQLAYFIEHHGLSTENWNRAQQEDGETLSDVNSGDAYRSLREQGKIDENTVTLQLNADGAKYFKVSRFGVWIFMAIINEAKYGVRRKFVVLLSIWIGNKKPPRGALMDGSIEELKRIETDGFIVNGKRYKLRVLVITVDTIARSGLMDTTQCNGECGCNFCLHPGEQIQKGRGSIRVYPQPDPEYDEDNSREHITFPLRNLEQHLRDVDLAVRSGKRVNGVIGPNPFMKLPDFDFVKALVPEYLHSCCHGSFKLYLELLTSTVAGNGKQKWYVGKKMKVINERLMLTRPPYEITRTVERLNNRSDWKASTYRTFTLYLFPILEDILPHQYFAHYSSLSYGVYLLLQNRVSREDVLKAKILFEQIVIDMEKLYGLTYISINVHFLIHLCQAVLDWGCLWSTSTFIPEWVNGDVMSLSSGTQHVAEQMAVNYLIKQAVRDEALELINKENLPPQVVSLLSQLLCLPAPRELTKGLTLNEGKVKLLGATTDRRDLTIHEEIAIRNSSKSLRNKVLGVNDVIHSSFYSRIQLKETGSIFTTSSYTRSPKRVNYFVFMADGNFLQIENILTIEIDKESRAFIIGKKIGAISKKNYVPQPLNGTVFSIIPGHTTKLIGLSKELYAYDPIDIKAKCVAALMNSLTETFVLTAIVNSFETD